MGGIDNKFLPSQARYLVWLMLSNHYHIVVHIDKERLKELSDKAVMDRWCQLFKGPLIIQKLRAGQLLSQAERDTASSIIAIWRNRLVDLGWFMKCLNEFISRKANAEDNCKGHFWESRYKSQALLDEVALLSCMSYVDLNPIRAGVADSLESSEYTSIQERLAQYKKQLDKKKVAAISQFEEQTATAELRSFLPDSGGLKEMKRQKHIPFKLLDYLQLLEWTGRVRRLDKRAVIPDYVPPILVSLGVDESEWQSHIDYFGVRYFHIVGAPKAVETLAQQSNYKWLKGVVPLRKVYSN